MVEPHSHSLGRLRPAVLITCALAAGLLAVVSTTDTALATTGGRVRRIVMDEQPRVPDVRLVDRHGRTVSLADAVTSDTPVFVNFIFTSCTTICPVMSAGFARLDARLHAGGRRARLVSISIDPETDTPARLSAYAARFGASDDWWFLTGAPDTIEAAQKAFTAFRGAPQGHTPTTFLRRSASAPWERLDGLVGEDALVEAYGDR